MTTKKITKAFPAVRDATQRTEFLKELLTKEKVTYIRNAVLHKPGYPDMDYGYGDEDLAFADSITILCETE